MHMATAFLVRMNYVLFRMFFSLEVLIKIEIFDIVIAQLQISGHRLDTFLIMQPGCVEKCILYLFFNF